MLQDSEFFASLYQLKTEPEVLIKLLSKVSHIYGEETADLIRSLIRQNHHQRPMAMCVFFPFLKFYCFFSQRAMRQTFHCRLSISVRVTLAKWVEQFSYFFHHLIYCINLTIDPRDKQDDIYCKCLLPWQLYDFIVSVKLMKSKYSVDAQLVLLQELVDHVESCGMSANLFSVSIVQNDITFLGTYFTLRESFMKMLLANIDQHMKCPELVTKCFLILYYGKNLKLNQMFRALSSSAWC